MQSDSGRMRLPPSVTLARPRLPQCLRTHQTVNALGDCRRFSLSSGEGELYPNCNDTAEVRSNARNQVEHQNVLTPETDWTLLRTEVRAPASCAHFAR